MSTNKTPKNAQKMCCDLCKFTCSKLSEWNRHILTAKHKNQQLSTNCQHQKEPTHYRCECGKEYKERTGLWKHKKNCKYIEAVEETDYKELLVEAMKQMKQKDEQVSEAMKQMMEHQKQITDMIPLIGNNTTNNTTNNNTNNNTTNNKFNLNFFLNTQCKDAMSIQSFMENLNIGSKELEHMGDVGFLNGMIDIFNNTIGNMDIHKRPLHCTDKKREVLYFKQGDEWEKDSTDKQQLKKLIKNVENKNYYNVREWSKAHKESFTSETAAGDQYVKIATEALGGADSTKDSIYLSKIMKHIIREVTVKV
jgi:hypothetical protein